MDSPFPPPGAQRPEEEEHRTRLPEKEKKRLSLLEDKLTDSLTLLLQLRNKVVTCAQMITHTFTHTSFVHAWSFGAFNDKDLYIPWLIFSIDTI